VFCILCDASEVYVKKAAKDGQISQDKIHFELYRGSQCVCE